LTAQNPRAEWVTTPIGTARRLRHGAHVRILVLWSPCRGVDPGGDAEWAHHQVQRLNGCAGIAALALHPATTAAVRDPLPTSWCLELRVAEGHAAHEVVRLRPFESFLRSLRLFGMQPRILAIEGDV
jgi:hypothetical protein